MTLIMIVALVAVVFSKRDETVKLLQSMFSAMSNLIGVIVQPITSSPAGVIKTLAEGDPSMYGAATDFLMLQGVFGPNG